MTAMTSLDIAWCGDIGHASALAQFFAANINPSYISHSELQGPRALDVDTWRPDLVRILRDEIEGRIARYGTKTHPAADTYPVLVAKSSEHIVAIALVSLLPTAPVPYAVVEDVVVDRGRRASGIGKAVLDWITTEARSLECRRLFLESGFGNHRAHDFFHREGFAECSVVMMKTIVPA